MGIHSDSVIMVDNVATVFENEIDRRIGICLDLTPIDAAIRATFGV